MLQIQLRTLCPQVCTLLRHLVSGCPRDISVQMDPTQPCTLDHSLPNLNCCSLGLLPKPGTLTAPLPCQSWGFLGFASEASLLSSLRLLLRERVLRVLQGSAPQPPDGASSSVSAPLTHPPQGSPSSLSEMQIWLCCPCLKPRCGSPLPSAPLHGLAFAPSVSYWVIPFWNPLSGPPGSLGASSCLHTLAHVLAASGVLSFLIMVTNSPYCSSVSSASPGGNAASLNVPKP